MKHILVFPSISRCPDGSAWSWIQPRWESGIAFFCSALNVIVTWNRMSVLCVDQTQTLLVLLRLSNQSTIQVLVLAVLEELLASHPSACNLSRLHSVTMPKPSVCRAARQPQSCRITSSSLPGVCRMRTESPGPGQRPAASPLCVQKTKAVF